MRQVHRPAVVAESEEALVDDVEGRFGPHPFHHRRLCGMRKSGVAQRNCVVAKLTDRGDLALTLDQGEGDALIGRDRRIEGGAGLRIFPRLVERGLSAADALQRDQRATEIEAAHHVGEPLVLLTEAVLRRHAHTFEEDGAPADDVAADVVEARSRDSRRIGGNDQGGDACGAALSRSCAGEDDEGVGAVGEGDRRLLAV